MKRFHFFPFLIPEGVTYEMQTLLGGRPNYQKTQIALTQYIEYMKWKWYRRFPFRILEPWLSWEIYADETQIRYFIWAPNKEWGNEFWYRLYTLYPEHNFRFKPTPQIDFSKPHAGMKLFLERDFTVPMRIYKSDDIDTQSSLLDHLKNVEPGEHVGLQFLMRPVFDYQTTSAFRSALRYVNHDRSASKKETDLYRKAITEKSIQTKAEVAIRLVATAGTYERAFELVDQTYRSLSYMNSTELNRFKSREWWQIARPLFRYEWKKRIFSFRKPENSIVLGTNELAGLMRLPSIADTPKFIRLKGKRVLLPVEVRSLANHPKPTILLGTNDRNVNSPPVHLPVEDLKRHVSIIGGAKTGKSTFLLNILSDFLKLKTEDNKYGLTLIDTDGRLADKLLEQIPAKWHHLVRAVRFRDAVQFPFNPYDVDFHASDNRKSNLIAEIFQRMGGNWDPFMKEIFLTASLALLKVEMATLDNLLKVIEDDEFCKRIICLLDENDPEQASLIRGLMRNLYNTKHVDWRREFVLSSSMDRFRRLTLSYEGILLSKHTSGIQWRQVLDEGHIVILDTSGGPMYDITLFSTISYILFRQAMISRTDHLNQGIPLPMHLLAVDDATFLANCFENLDFVLNEARQYNVPFILANQGMKAHLPDGVIETIFRNFSTILALRQGNPADAQIARENMEAFGLSVRDLSMIEPPVGYLQMSVNNEKMRAFSLMTRPSPNPVHDEGIEKLLADTIKRAEDIEEKTAIIKSKKQKKAWQHTEAKMKALNKKLEQLAASSSDEDADDFVDIFYDN